MDNLPDFFTDLVVILEEPEDQGSFPKGLQPETVDVFSYEDNWTLRRKLFLPSLLFLEQIFNIS